MTPIFKLPIGISPQGLDLSTSVENEWLCAQIFRAFNIPTAVCQIAHFGEFKTLVERFDRKLASGGKWWLRLPQEDFCQATGTPPALKYENDGGPVSLRSWTCYSGQLSPSPTGRILCVRRRYSGFWLPSMDTLKIFSIFLEAGGRFRLTPRYDVLSAYPVIGHGKGKLAIQKIKMAMAAQGKRKHYEWRGIRARHWLETAKRCGLPGMNEIMNDVVETTPDVVAAVIKNLPENS